MNAATSKKRWKAKDRGHPTESGPFSQLAKYMHMLYYEN